MESSPSDSTYNKRKRLFFKGLNKYTTRNMVHSVLSTYGDIEYLRLPFSKHKNINMGHGFVIFNDYRVVLRLILDVRTINIDGYQVSFTEYQSEKTNSRYCKITNTSSEIPGKKGNEERNNNKELRIENNMSLEHIKPTSRGYHIKKKNIITHGIDNVRMRLDIS